MPRPSAWLAWLVLACLPFCPGFHAKSVSAAEEASLEYKVKAAFLYRLAGFVEWPKGTLPPSPDAPLYVGVMGESPFRGALEEAVRDKTVKGRPLSVVPLRHSSDVRQCQIVFITASESTRFDELLKSLGEKPILTVGEHDTFTRHGGMINFYVEKNKVRLEINTAAADRAKLRIHAQVLNLGKITHDGKEVERP